MRPVEAVKTGFKKVFVFKGRASRSEFWFFYLFYSLIASLAFAIVSLILDPTEFSTGSTEFWIFAISLWVLNTPTFSAFVRRWHDTNHSGWWFIGICVYAPVANKIIGAAIGQPMNPIALLLSAPPFIVMIWLEIMLFWPGTTGENRYGADPLEHGRTG